MPKTINLLNTISEYESNSDSLKSSLNLEKREVRLVDSESISIIDSLAPRRENQYTPPANLKIKKTNLTNDNFNSIIVSEEMSSDTFDFGVRDKFLPKSMFSVVVLGRDKINNNAVWRQLVSGDQPVFDIKETFHFENFNFRQPLTSLESDFVFAKVFDTVYDGKTSLNDYSSDYLFFKFIESELDMPSLMLLFAFYEREQIDKEEDIKNTLNPNINIKQEIYRILSLDNKIPMGTARVIKPQNINKFLITHALEFKEATLRDTIDKQKNIIFDSYTFKQDYEELAKNAIAYNMLQLPMKDFGVFGKVLKRNNMLFKLLVDLKDVINQRGLIDYYEEPLSFDKEYYNLILPNNGGRLSYSDRTYTNSSLSATANLKAIDFIDFLIAQSNCLDDPLLDDCILVSEGKYFRELQKETKYSNKFVLNKRLNSVLKDIQELIRQKKPTYENVVNDDETYSEVLFYRLEKRKGIDTTDNREQAVIQNFYFTNSDEAKTFKIFDSQILPKETYTYNLFEYRLSIGLDYYYSNALYSQQFATSDECSLLVDPEQPELPIRPTDQFSLSVQNVRNRVQAEVIEQPTLILYEIPVTTQELTLVPYPPHRPSNSFHVYPQIPNTLFVEVDVETMDSSGRYIPLTEQDTQYLTQVKASYGIVDDIIPNDNKVPIKEIEIRIVHEEPSSMSSFSIPDRIETFTLKTKNGYETKKTLQLFLEENTEHYFIVRVVNEMGIASSVDTIYSCKINSDSDFRNLEIDVFDPNKKDEDAIVSYRDFSNFLRVKLAEGQRFSEDLLSANLDEKADVYINSGLPKRNANILKDAFNRKFKFRVTSKSSGKKVDVNFTFRTKKE